MRIQILALAFCSLVFCTAFAEQDEPQVVPDAVALAGAYQSGYLQLAAVSAFQLYSSTGIIQGDLLSGSVSPKSALNALEHNSLLQSVCASTLGEIRSLTPPYDTEGLAELDRLISVNTAEGELLRALADFCLEPNEAEYQAVLAAQQQVEIQLEKYTQTNQQGLLPAPSDRAAPEEG